MVQLHRSIFKKVLSYIIYFEVNSFTDQTFAALIPLSLQFIVDNFTNTLNRLSKLFLEHLGGTVYDQNSIVLYFNTVLSSDNIKNIQQGPR